MSHFRDSIFINSDNAVYVRGLRADNAASGVTIDDATVTLSLHLTEAAAAAGTSPVTGASSISMTYVTDSNGDYRGVLPYSVTLTLGDVYWVRILIVSDAGRSVKVRQYTVRTDNS